MPKPKYRFIPVPEIKDYTSLKEACEDLGLTYQTLANYYSTQNKPLYPMPTGHLEKVEIEKK